MEGSERDDTQDWLLPEGAAPPLLSELEQRIDEAMVIAKASEQAVMSVGEAAFDAADQARRAADLAERASAAAVAADAARERAEASVPAANAPLEDAALRSFSERADRVVARLRAVCAPGASSRAPGLRSASRSAGPRRGSPGDR